MQHPYGHPVLGPLHRCLVVQAHAACAANKNGGGHDDGSARPKPTAAGLATGGGVGKSPLGGEVGTGIRSILVH